MRTVSFKAAAAHTASVYLDPLASANKACSVIAEASRNGASLVVFSESFLPGFPIWAALYPPIQSHEHFRRFLNASVYVDGPEIERVRKAATDYGVFVSIGFSERNPASVGGLWNSNILISDAGQILIHHRKLVATFFEKLVWDPGDGAGLVVANTRIGRIGGLICGENTNPLARYTLMTQAEQVHISTYPPIWPTRVPTERDNYDNRAANRIRASAHCFEAKCFGIIVAGRLDESARQSIALNDPTVAAVIDASPKASSFFLGPTGAPVGDELIDEGIGYAHIDLEDCIEPKRFHDVVAGYNRFDIFDVAVNRTRRKPIKFVKDITTESSTDTEVQALPE
ncbi:carbon-nitrogen hydrolase family protein [Neorhizobium galegae]|uniref:Nitrile hydratase n=1 Tax=Neorhizobium galegae bv. officinalis TaxID=323656 RepID=A0A0T7G7J7_NEOGA|nr:carbon-nitrogen hydrolase family protein [Neorhizobium galegae]KAA9382440.1 carbon-nitrogen hydrolase family protein [Neorhizobium galegae]KAB1110062.1 carbon-nitrogen hydrolase family protein [Neorhizobium galegae]MCM2497559.1 carbon-nitrogen hydrolase family protein [Neorhizobium galegae]MCQ1769579.1 carbon-nitrogen hydrolase family protein [Neorhizobium galegae]MCQ1775171.1 carbon-nitrogen hydrolase family protein [Neorhizobium galegae]